MSDVDHARRLAFTGRRTIHIGDVQLPEPREGEVRFETHISLMNLGTGNIVSNRLLSHAAASNIACHAIPDGLSFD